MKDSRIYAAIFVFLTAYILGGLVADIGEKQPAYEVTWSIPITHIVIFVGVYALGYLTAKHEDQ